MDRGLLKTGNGGTMMSQHSVPPRAAFRSTAPELPNVGHWATPPRIGAGLAGQVRDGVADLPWYLVSPLLRHWHRTWGPPQEVAAPMPGDRLLPQARYRCTRAITIDQPSWLLWRTPNRSWAWRLIPLAGERTRLITRLKTVYEWSFPRMLSISSTRRLPGASAYPLPKEGDQL